MEAGQLREKLADVLQQIKSQDIKDKLLLSSIKSFLPHLLVLLAAVGAIISIQIYKNSLPTHAATPMESETRTKKQPNTKKEQMYVDVSGAVKNPDMYEVPAGTRLAVIIKIAGGLAENADRGFFARNFNLSSIIGDQQKIHVPSIFETSQGLYIERTKIISAYSDTQKGQSAPAGEQSSPRKISINNSSSVEIETLKGIGKITTDRIIASRPYESLDDLVTKGILKKALFDSIKEEIEL